MNVISLKDYAKQKNISYEAVRQQVVRYKKDLDGHLIKDGRQQFLDDEAVAFLDAKRQKNPVAIIQMDKNEQIEHLEAENKALLQKVAIIQEELLKEKDKVQTLLNEKKEETKLLEGFIQDAKKEIEVLNAEKGDLSNNLKEKDEILEETKKEAEKVNMELQEAQKRIEELKSASLIKRIFGWKKGVE